MAPVTTGQGLRRDPLLLDEKIDQGLHGFHFLVGHQPVVFGHGDKMDEAHVQDIVLVDVPKGIEPMRVVQMGVAAEHLLHDALAVLIEGRWETAGLADPFLPIGGSSRAGRVGTGNFVERESFRDTGHLIGRKHDRVMNLADNPLLHAVNELRGGDLGSTAIHEPGVSQTKKEKG